MTRQELIKTVIYLGNRFQEMQEDIADKQRFIEGLQSSDELTTMVKIGNATSHIKLTKDNRQVIIKSLQNEIEDLNDEINVLLIDKLQVDSKMLLD